MLTVSWTEGSRTMEYQVKVTGIVDNYAFHYVYITPAYYQSITGGTLEYNYLFCQIPNNFTPEQKVALEKNINNIQGVNGSVYTTVVIDNFSNVVNTLNMVIVLFIVAGMALAFVVLYMLNNINVNERIRELATLKVLGFKRFVITNHNKTALRHIHDENVTLLQLDIIRLLLLIVGNRRERTLHTHINIHSSGHKEEDQQQECDIRH
jgi:putative ABC transport system permease protein